MARRHQIPWYAFVIGAGFFLIVLLLLAGVFVGDGQEHWWLVGVALGLQAAGFLVFGSVALWAYVIGPLIARLRSDGEDEDLSIESIRRGMIDRREITGTRSAYRDTRHLGPP